MHYLFDGYQFDSDRLLLSQQGHVLPLRNNEARLLHFFLCSPPQVYSKTQILDAVWRDRVVGEQAVFQAISNLRQQFGDSAIRTYSKKGYQWQLAVETRSELMSTCSSHHRSDMDSQAPHTLQPATAAVKGVVVSRNHDLRWALAWLSMIGLIYWLVSTPERTSAVWPAKANDGGIKAQLIMQFFALDAMTNRPHTAEQFTADLRQQLSSSPWLLTTAPPTASEAQLWSSPQRFLPTNTAFHNIVLTGRLTHLKHQHRLWLVLQGAQHRWQYRLQANSIPELRQQLVELLQLIVPQTVLWQSQDQRLVHAQWQLLVHQAPLMLPLQQSRVQTDISFGDISAAQLHSEQWLQQATQQQDLAQQVFALQQQAEIAVRSANITQAQQLLDRATVLAKRTGDAKLMALHLRRYFAIWYSKHQFEPLEAVLLQALQLARSLNDEALVVEILLDLTIASFKFDQTAKKNDYFIQTQNQLNLLQLAPENTARLELFAGINSPDKHQAEQLFVHALQRLSPQQSSTTKSQLQQQLVNLYMQQQQPSKARALFQSTTELTALEHYLLATIANAAHEPTVAEQHARAAFTAATLTGQNVVALDASLLLLQIPANHQTQAMSREYLRQHASPAWRQQHQRQLHALAQ